MKFPCALIVDALCCDVLRFGVEAVRECLRGSERAEAEGREGDRSRSFFFFFFPSFPSTKI